MTTQHEWLGHSAVTFQLSGQMNFLPTPNKTQKNQKKNRSDGSEAYLGAIGGVVCAGGHVELLLAKLVQILLLVLRLRPAQALAPTGALAFPSHSALHIQVLRPILHVTCCQQLAVTGGDPESRRYYTKA